MTEVSVVVPTYNRADLIGETLTSILRQTTPVSEIIVVDDGSRDTTSSVVASFGSQVKYIRIENSGDLVARNVGLRIAKSHFVAFCDSDDLWMPSFISTMLAQWQAEPNLTACYANFRILQNGTISGSSKFDQAPDQYWSGLRTTKQQTYVLDSKIFERMLQFQPFFPSCLMVPRSRFLELGGWDEGVSRIVGCDFGTALRIAVYPPIGVVMQPLVSIRKHSGNISGNTERMALGDAQVLEHVLETRPDTKPLAPLIQESIASRRRAALDLAFSRRDFIVVRDLYRRIPPGYLSTKLQLKSAIAFLPRPVSTLVAKLISLK